MSEEKKAVIPQEELQQDTNELRKVRIDKLEAMQAEGRDPFVITKYDQTHHSAVIKESFEELEGKTVRVAGRMMSKRIMGKASFCNIQDLKGNIQSYVARDSIGEEEYKDFKKLDIGDIIGIEGSVFKTKTGEISVHAEKVVLLSKSLLPLPEKFHGLAVRVSARLPRGAVHSVRRVDDVFRRCGVSFEVRGVCGADGFAQGRALRLGGVHH